MIGSVCTWRYLIIYSLLHLPISLMILVSTAEQRSAMAPAVRRDRAKTYLCVNPRWVHARSLTVVLRWSVVIVGVTFVQRPLGALKWSRGVSAGAPCYRRWSNRLRNASFVHNRGSPVAPWPIFLPCTPFFCVVKTSIENVSAGSSLSVVLAVSNIVQPTLNVTSDKRNGELSYFVPVYSPGRRRKKKAIMIMSATACSS